ncbi:hypothetical protein V6N12_062336 [Hibiscus sabdariffa]|uniref:Uncharacterized protein n=1 Tax=Hibiscus sabdariffa TaxID=183260 RepID=A0ABR2F8I3_9ROSI
MCLFLAGSLVMEEVTNNLFALSINDNEEDAIHLDEENQQNLVNLDATAFENIPSFDIQMGLDHEENSIEHTYGNKRARMNSVSTTISSSQDFNTEMRVSSEVTPNTISVSLKNQFKFEASWLQEESCEDEVRKLWELSSDHFLERMDVIKKGLDL